MALIISTPVTFVVFEKTIWSLAKEETPGWKQSLFGGKNLSITATCFFGLAGSHPGVILSTAHEVHIN